MTAVAPRHPLRVRVPHVPPVVQDVALAVVFAAVAVVESRSGDALHAGPAVVNLLITGTVVALLALRRAAPARVLLLTAAVVGLPTLVVRHDFFLWSHMAPLVIGTYTVARHRGGRVALLCLLVVLPCLWLDFAVLQPWDPQSVLWSALFLGAIFVGSRLRRSAVVRDALREARLRLEAGRLDRERSVVLRERARLALELQDTVSTAVSLMTAQAAAAEARLASDPEGSRTSVLALERAGREATADLRRMLGLLRTDHEDGPGRPVPTLDAVQDLPEAFAAAGLPVELRVRGVPGDLPAAFGVTAYRLLHDALSAAVGSGADRALVTIDYGESVRVGLRTGRGAPEVTRSIRERAAMLHGTVEARADGMLVELPRPAG